jgi:tRNA (cytosine38-C5)-methyltransferase
VSANLNNLISIGDILEENQDFSQYYISDKILRKYFNILDICYSHSRNSCCFTKSYSRYIEGAGSVFTEKSEEFVKTILSQIENVEKGSDEYLKLVVQLKLRFFTPREVCRLMCFPETFSFPPGMENRKKYMLLGNSVNVKVVIGTDKTLGALNRIYFHFSGEEIPDFENQVIGNSRQCKL